MAKTLSARVIHMHDVDANWNKLPTFIPKQGEVIVYDPDEELKAIALDTSKQTLIEKET